VSGLDLEETATQAGNAAVAVGTVALVIWAMGMFGLEFGVLMRSRAAVLRGIVLVSVLAAAIAMGIASAVPEAGEAAVAGALLVSLGYSIFASHQRRRAAHHSPHNSPKRGRSPLSAERFERSGEPASAQH
jgi:hypothetical protein